ncbi:hypothetical protein D3C76_868720 [compost metagenome]
MSTEVLVVGPWDERSTALCHVPLEDRLGVHVRHDVEKRRLPGHVGHVHTQGIDVFQHFVEEVRDVHGDRCFDLFHFHAFTRGEFGEVSLCRHRLAFDPGPTVFGYPQRWDFLLRSFTLLEGR